MITEASSRVPVPSTIVAIGGSAGGSASLMEAFSRLQELPLEQMAFVVQLHQPMLHPSGAGNERGAARLRLRQKGHAVQHKPEARVDEPAVAR